MSVNQSSQEFLWWTPHHDHQHQPRMNFNINQPHDGEDDRASPGRAEENGNSNFQQEKLEVMFEKTLTPSDVGKLNRLVIPKQHAERHFPLSNNSSGDDACGMMLSFEDEDGKFWRFRYSYWNSSQSYVLTKGWSRYVKAKQLEAGDIVLFDRHSTDPDRLFIGWRRRHDPSQMMNQSNTKSAVAAACLPAFGGGGLYPPYQYRPDPEASAQAGVNQRRTTSFSSSRTLRLFGVNMEYQFESDQSEPATPDGSSTSSPSGHIVYQNYNTQFSPRAPSYGMSNNIVQQHASASHGQHRR